MGKIINGKEIALKTKEEIKEFVEENYNKTGKKPQIASILVGEDGGSIYYLNSQEKVATSLGLLFKKIILKESTTEEELLGLIDELNNDIKEDPSLGEGFMIGHSYFCGRDVCTEEWLHSIVDYDILPMLSEYWFDDANKLQRWENILQGVFQ